MRPAIVLLTCLASFLAGCSGPTSPSDGVSPGVWGGNGIKMTVTAKGATLEFDCAAGAIGSPLPSGHFTADGTFSFDRGGPRQVGDPPATAHPARYDGAIDGKSMQLSIFVTDLSQSMGTFVLGLGRQPLLNRCL